jgi:hypothetical protein
VIYPFLQQRFLQAINENGGWFSIGIDSTEMQKTRFHAIVIRFDIKILKIYIFI